MSYPKPPLELRTNSPHLYMRTPRADEHDATGLSEYFTAYKRDIQTPGDTSQEHYTKKIQEWLAAAKDGEYYCFVVVLTSEPGTKEKIIGIASYNGFSTNTDANGISRRVADIGMGVAGAQKRKGYGTAIVKTLIDRAFDTFGADVVEADTLVTNTPFQGLMKSLKLDQFANERMEDGEEEYLYSFTKAQWYEIQH